MVGLDLNPPGVGSALGIGESDGVPTFGDSGADDRCRAETTTAHTDFAPGGGVQPELAETTALGSFARAAVGVVGIKGCVRHGPSIDLLSLLRSGPGPGIGLGRSGRDAQGGAPDVRVLGAVASHGRCIWIWRRYVAVPRDSVVRGKLVGRQVHDIGGSCARQAIPKSKAAAHDEQEREERDNGDQESSLLATRLHVGRGERGLHRGCRSSARRDLGRRRVLGSIR